MSQLTEQQVLDLAPSDLEYSRGERYGGRHLSVSLDAFKQPDRRRVERLYGALMTLQDQLESIDRRETGRVRTIISDFLDDCGWKRLVEWARGIDEPSDPEIDAERFSQVRHDLKGGALAQLVSGLQLAEAGKLDDEQVSKIYLRVRDHTKIMRNAIPDLDPKAYQRDSQEKIHEAALIVEKWKRTELVDGEGRPVEVSVEAGYEGPISDRCVEFAALDRVVYNMMNNAVEGTADGRIELYLTAVPAARPRHLRIAVANRVDDERARSLEERFGGRDLSSLFLDDYTTSGSGLGLRICGTFVGFAYGVGAAGAVEEGHVGARLIDGGFVNWVHWPMVTDD